MAEFHIGKPERRVVYAWEDEVAELKAENKRLLAEVARLEKVVIKQQLLLGNKAAQDAHQQSEKDR